MSHRRRRWPNIETTLAQFLVFPGMAYIDLGKNIPVHTILYYPRTLRKQTNAGLMLGQRLQCWLNIKTTLLKRPLFAASFAMFQSLGTEVRREDLYSVFTTF